MVVMIMVPNISLQEGKGKNKFPFPLYKGDCKQNSH